MSKKFFGKTDFIIIAVLLVISALLFIPRLSGSKNLTAEISHDGKVIEKIDLSKVSSPYKITLDGAVISVEENQISFESADCPDKLCVHCGKLKNKGDTAVCIPTRTVVRIVGSDSGVNAITY